MGRKVRSILLLMTVLLLIYWQHSPVIYAGEAANTVKDTDEGTSEENAEDAGDDSGGDADGSSGNADEGEEGEEGEKAGGEGEEEEEKEGEEGKGEEGKGEEGEEEVGESDKGGDKGEEVSAYEKYELEYTRSDGKEGYYITPPKIRICHVSKRGSTCYTLHSRGEKMAEGRFTKAGEEIVLAEGQFKEGANILSIYMEDSEGRRLEGMDYVREFRLDTKAPIFEMSAPEGFDVWYRDAVRILVSGKDGENGSGILSVSCRCEDEVVGTVKGEEGEFIISRPSSGGKGASVTVTVTDKAGHRSEKTRKVYIDNSPPEMDIEGATDYMITGRPTLVTCKVSEENGLKQLRASVEHEAPDGIKREMKGGWEDKDGTKECILPLEEDGIYHLDMSATDMAGNVASKKMQMILDTQDPLIRHVDKLEGQHMREFCWSYEKEAVIEDFTSYTYQIWLDGGLYAVGDKVYDEGRHVLCVEATDSAGNKAQAKAGFVIDRTPPKILFLDVEEEGTYEEEKSFQIVLENLEDEVCEIRINEELQPLGQKKEAYQYTVQGRGNYKVSVHARDKAGNESMARTVFEVVPEETILQKTVKPIKEMFMKGKREIGKGDGVDESCRAFPIIPAAAPVMATGGAAVALAIKIYRKRRLCQRRD